MKDDLKIPVDFEIKQKMRVEIDLMDVLDAMDDLPPAQKWNALGKIINGLSLSPLEVDKIHLATIIKFLDSKLQIFTMLQNDINQTANR